MPGLDRILDAAPSPLGALAPTGPAAPGRTHFEGTDEPSTIVKFAKQLLETGGADDARAILEAFGATYPDQRPELEDVIHDEPALVELWP